MILFKNDWGKYPTASPDYTTSNKSFIKLANTYKQMKVKNYNFHLALVNQELKQIDPHSPELTDREKGMVLEECFINPWYFFREVAKAPAASGARKSPFRANRGNIGVYWLAFNHATIMNIQQRQSGKSFSADMLTVYMTNICTRDTLTNLMTKDDQLRSENIARIRKIADALPDYVNRKTKLDSRNMQDYTVKALGNTLRVHVPGNSIGQAYKKGRGLTSAIILLDELPYQTFCGTSLPAMLSSAAEARRIAASANAPYYTLITTTAGKQNDRDGKYAYELLQDCAIWNEHLLDTLNTDALKKTVCNMSPSKDFWVNCTFDHRQLGYTDEEFREIVKNSKTVFKDADRDWFNIWTAGTETHPLDYQLLEKLRDHRIEPIHTDIDPYYNYLMKWYIEEEDIDKRMGDSTIISLDTSEAVGRDDIALSIRDPYTMDMLATSTCNYTNLSVYTKWLYNLLIKYPKMTMIIELRSTGISIVDQLSAMMRADGINPFRRIMNRVIQEKAEKPDRYRTLADYDNNIYNDHHVKYKNTFGFPTMGGDGIYSRNNLYKRILKQVVENCYDVIHDTKTIEQILSLTKVNGRIDHKSGNHDDAVISLLLSHWLMTEGVGLSYYGIDQDRIRTRRRTEETMTLEERYYHIEQRNFKKALAQVISELESSKDEFRSAILRNKAISISSKINAEEGIHNNIHEVLKEIRANKLLQKRNGKKRSNFDKRKLAAIRGYG